MAMDSIIAWPTNKVRVMVLEASGCCASEVKADETARPSPSRGRDTPQADCDSGGNDRNDRDNRRAVHRCPSVADGRDSCGAGPRGGRDVNGGEDAENVRLHHAGEQTEQVHEDREERA